MHKNIRQEYTSTIQCQKEMPRSFVFFIFIVGYMSLYRCEVNPKKKRRKKVDNKVILKLMVTTKSCLYECSGESNEIVSSSQTANTREIVLSILLKQPIMCESIQLLYFCGITISSTLYYSIIVSGWIENCSRIYILTG